MPELPEVQTVCQGLQSLSGQTLKMVVVRQPQLRWPIPADLHQLLQGQKIISVKRRAKYLLLHFETGTLIIHLGMSGQLSLQDQLPLAEKHDHADFIFSQEQLRYTDPRRFGAILYTQKPAFEHPRLCKLGPEPLENSFNPTYLFDQCQKKTVAIKAMIMNPHIVVGVGNIYATEALFHAGIHPLTTCKRLSRDDCKRLTNTIKKTLKAAIEQGGTTLKDFKNTQHKPGYFQQQLYAYGKAGKPCLQCTTPIDRIILQQRSSFFCSKCQPLL